MNFSGHRRLSFDLLPFFAVSVLAVVAVIAVDTAAGTLAGTGMIRGLVAGAYLLFVPGYALLGVLFPRVGDVSLLERGVFSVGASLALVALLGIPLDGTPWGITLVTILVEQFVVVGVLMGIAEFRRSRVDADIRATPAAEVATMIGDIWAHRNVVGGGNRVLQAVIVLSVVVSVGAVGYTLATPLPSEQFTEMSIVGSDGTVDGLPQNATTGETVEFQLGIRNNEYEEINYGLQTQVNTSNGSRVLSTDRVRLPQNQTLSRTLRVQMPDESGRVKVQLLLYQRVPPGDPVNPETAYRSVQLVVDVEDA